MDSDIDCTMSFFSKKKETTNLKINWIRYTLPTAQILNGKNVRAWVAMVLHTYINTCIACLYLKVLPTNKPIIAFKSTKAAGKVEIKFQ